MKKKVPKGKDIESDYLYSPNTQEEKILKKDEHKEDSIEVTAS